MARMMIKTCHITPCITHLTLRIRSPTRRVHTTRHRAPNPPTCARTHDHRARSHPNAPQLPHKCKYTAPYRDCLLYTSPSPRDS